VSEIIEIIQKSYFNFNMAGAIYPLFLVALFYLYLQKENVEDKKFFLYPTIICAIIVLCPITAWVIMDFFLGRDVYWRIWWLFPVLPTVAYVGVKIVMSQKKKKKQGMVLIFLTIIIAFSGRSIYTRETMRKPENIFKLPNNVCEISDMIAADSNNQEVLILISHDLIEYIRLYDPNIKLLYGRETIRMNLGTAEQLAVFEELVSEEPDMEVVATHARAAGCEYIVLSKLWDIEEVLRQNDYILLGNTSGYSVYKDIQ
jgi:hypothetical protein